MSDSFLVGEVGKRQGRSVFGADLAHIHQVGFEAFAEQAAAGLLEHLQRAGIDEGLVLDLGCGTGVWARTLIAAGYRVVGWDISPDMVGIASKRAPQAKFQVRSFAHGNFPRSRAITAIGEVLCYRSAAKRLALQPVVQAAYRSLEAGGLFIFDVAETTLEPVARRTFFEGTDWACLVSYQRDPDDAHDQHLMRRIITFRRQGRAYRRSEELHRIQLYRAAEIAALLRKNGFRVRTYRRYGELELLPHRIAFVARKAESPRYSG